MFWTIFCLAIKAIRCQAGHPKQNQRIYPRQKKKKENHFFTLFFGCDDFLNEITEFNELLKEKKSNGKVSPERCN